MEDNKRKYPEIVVTPHPRMLLEDYGNKDSKYWILKEVESLFNVTMHYLSDSGVCSPKLISMASNLYSWV